MFKLLFLKRLYDLSDKKLIERASYDMSFKYFLNLLPEDKLVDSSLLTKFRKTRIKSEEILDELLAEIIKQAIAKGIIKSNAIIIDATHTQSKGNSETPTQMLRRLSKELRKNIYRKRPELASKFPEKPSKEATLEEEIEYTEKLVKVLEQDITEKDDKKIKNRYEKIKKLLQNDKIREIQSAIDEDAKKGYKSETNSFFGYKNHIAITEDRLISALEVSTGSAPDGKYLSDLVEKTEKNGLEIKEIIADTAYSERGNLEYVENKEIKLISKLNPVISNGNRNKDDGFEYIKDADMIRCPAGHLAIKKYKERRHNRSNRSDRIKYYFDIEKCKKCPRKDGCYKDGAKKKTYSITILSEQHQNQKEFEKTEYFQKRSKQRYMIEAKNGELKQAHGLEKCKYLGLFGMQIQSYMTAIVANVKRIIKLTDPISA